MRFYDGANSKQPTTLRYETAISSFKLWFETFVFIFCLFLPKSYKWLLTVYALDSYCNVRPSNNPEEIRPINAQHRPFASITDSASILPRLNHSSGSTKPWRTHSFFKINFSWLGYTPGCNYACWHLIKCQSDWYAWLPSWKLRHWLIRDGRFMAKHMQILVCPGVWMTIN